MKRIITCMLLAFSIQLLFAQGKPFKGVWEINTEDMYQCLYIDLYGKTMLLPDGSAPSYGYLQSENEYNSDYWVISKVLSAEGNVAKIKMYSWRYGSPDDEKEETLTYDPVKKTLTVGKEHLTVFKDAPSITPALLKETYRNRDVKYEMVWVSFYPKGGGQWLMEASSSTVYEDGRMKYIASTFYWGTVQGNRIVFTHQTEGFMLDAETLNKENMKNISPCTMYYLSATQSFWMNNVVYIPFSLISGK